MGAPRSRADGRRNHDRILAAAQQLLRRSPEVTMAEVAEVAGLTRASVYRHFPDHEQLLDGVVVDLAATIVPLLLADLESRSLPDAMDHLAHAVITLSTEHRNLLIATSHRLEELARVAVSDDPIVLLLAERRASGELVSESSDAWLAACIRSLCLLGVTRGAQDEGARAELAHVLRRLVA